MTSINKYLKYKNKYNILKESLYGGSNNFKNSSCIPCIELYEFEIFGYNSNDRNTFSFGNIYNTPRNKCGIINILTNPSKHYNYNQKLNSSCDPIYSNKQLGGYISMEDYHKIYLNNKAKNNKPKENIFFTDEFKDEFINNLNYIIKNNMKYINRNEEIITDENIDNLHENGFVFRIKVPKEKKVIIMGDIHGSFHTFFRNMFRLIQLSILDRNFKLKENYIVIFLGDILDRGTYALEILSFICKLMIVNNNNTNHNIIYNRGNHEEINIWEMYGFDNELNIKFKELKSNNLLTRFFTTLSSAVILSCDIDNTTYSYWLSHGGIPVNENEEPLLIENTDVILYNKNYANQIRWNDFYVQASTGPSSRGNNIYHINQTTLIEFLKLNKINFVIRGHMDSVANSYLLSNVNNIHNAYVLGEVTNMSSSIVNINPNSFKSDKLNRNVKNGPIARIRLDTINNIDDGRDNLIFYPMLTLSTNTDKGRKLVHDSFGILRFDLNIEQISKFNKNTNVYDINNNYKNKNITYYNVRRY